MNIKKINGPKTNHCGTPCSISINLEILIKESESDDTFFVSLKIVLKCEIIKEKSNFYGQIGTKTIMVTVIRKMMLYWR